MVYTFQICLHTVTQQLDQMVMTPYLHEFFCEVIVVYSKSLLLSTEVAN